MGEALYSKLHADGFKENPLERAANGPVAMNWSSF